jgi:uncharacterized surface protein with fasciclin (FAS1) repeats
MADIVGALNTAGIFRVLLSLMKMTGVEEMLKDQDELTLLAPTDAAFAKLDPESMDELTQNVGKLRNILLHHILSGRMTSHELSEAGQIQTLLGESLGPDAAEDLDIATVSFSQTDIEADNAVIHAIDTLLFPTTKARR